MSIKTVFPSFVYSAPISKTANFKRVLRELKIEALQLKKMDKDGHVWCKKNYPGGYTSYSSFDQLHKMSSTFMELEAFLRPHIAKFVQFLEMDIQPKELLMSSCWVNVMPKGVTHSMHIHPLSTISGTMYVDLPKGTPGIKFEDPRQVQFMASPPRKVSASLKNQRFFTLQPKPGDVVLFESWMRHEVPMNQTNSERISISFNYDWR